MGTRECDLEEPGDLEPGDLLIALEGEDIFLVPRTFFQRRRAAALVSASRGRSTSRPVDNDDTLSVPQGCSGTHPVGKDETRALSARTKACAIDQVGSLIEWL